MKKKKAPLTILGKKFYIICIVVSIIFLFLYIVDTICIFDCEFLINFKNENIGFKLIESIKIIVQTFATGMLPAVLLALFTDIANTKRQRKNYVAYLKLTKDIVKEKCEYLMVIILECIDEPKEVNDLKMRSFLEWFEYFISLKNFQSRVSYLMYNISEIKCLSEKYETALAEYHDFVDFKEWQEEKEKVYEFIYDSDAFENALLSTNNNDNQNNNLSFYVEIFQRRVFNLFPDLKDKYNTPYNWNTFLKQDTKGQ